MREIPLTQGLVALVDDEDYELVSQWRWQAKDGRSSAGLWYAARPDNSKMRSARTMYMHRLVLNAPQGAMVDHINRNGLDNQRANLRLCTRSENAANKRAARSGLYRGVFWSRSARGWQACIKKDGQPRYLGTFASPEEAAKAYDSAAHVLFGAFACVNFPIVSVDA